MEPEGTSLCSKSPLLVPILSQMKLVN